MSKRTPIYQGEVVSIEKTSETRTDEFGEKWTNCIFTVKITGFPKGIPEENVERQWIGKTVQLKRWCCYDWHYKVPVRTTIDEEEFGSRINK